MICILSFLPQDANASTFTATQSGGWDKHATWGGGIPPVTINSGDTVNVPIGITVKIPLLVQVTSHGTINLSGSIYVKGVLSNFGDINNSGVINIANATFNNGGTVTNSGTIHIYNSSLFNNTGAINNSDSIGNSGTLSNSGTITNGCGKITGKPISGNPVIHVLCHHTSTMVMPNPSSVIHGNTIAFHAFVSDIRNGTKSTPTGTISWNDGSSGGIFSSSSCTLAQINSSSSSCDIVYTATSPVGPVTINATYSGDITHKMSSGISALTVTCNITCSSSNVFLNDTFDTDLAGWQHYGDPGYVVSLDTTTGQPVPSANISGDAYLGICSRHGMTKAVDISTYSGGPLTLALNWRASSSAAGSSHTTLAEVRIDNADTHTQLFVHRLADTTGDTGWQQYFTDISSFVSVTPRIQVDLYLYDCWAANYNEENWYDNVQLFAGTPSLPIKSMTTETFNTPVYRDMNITSTNSTKP